MKRILLLFTTLFCTFQLLNAQVTLDIADVEICDGQTTVDVPIIVQENFNINSAQFAVFWDGSGLAFNSIVGFKNPFSIALGPSDPPTIDTTNIAIFYLAPVNFAAGDTLCMITFDVTGGQGIYPVAFYQGTDPIYLNPPVINGTTIPNTVDGQVNILGSEPAFQNCPNTIQVANDPGQCGAVVSWMPPTVFDCEGDQLDSMVMGGMPGDFFPIGTSTITYTVSDSAGNDAIPCTFDIIVMDQEAPQLSCPADDIFNVAPPATQLDIPGNQIAPVVNENCALDSISIALIGVTTLSSEAFDVGASYTFNLGITQVTYIAVDTAGNADTCTFNVEVVQSTAPPVTIDIADVNLGCQVTDTVCVPVIVEDSVSFGGVQLAIVWDGAGLSYLDFQAPGATPITNVNNDTFGITYTFFPPQTYMEGDTLLKLIFEFVGNQGEQYDIDYYNGPNTIYNNLAFDGSSNQIPLNLLAGSVVAGSDTDPIITCPPDITLDCGAATDTSVTGVATAMDDCDPDPMIMFNEISSPTCGNTVIINRTFIATDDSGNSSSCLQTITTIDTVPPVANCADEFTVLIEDAGTGSISVNQIDNGSVDSCSTAVDLSASPLSFDCSQVGTSVPVTLIVTDDCGNVDSCTTMVLVADSIEPTVGCADTTIFLNASGNAVLDPMMVFDSSASADNCGPIIPTGVSMDAFDCSTAGPNVVTLFAEDDAGNEGSCTATVTVEDTIPPVAACLDVTVSLGASSQYDLSPSEVFDAANSADNCGSVNLLSVTPNAFDCNNLGDNPVTLTVEDASGNTDTCLATVTVQDTTGPIVVCKTDTVYIGGNGSVTVDPADVFDAMASVDSCSVVTPVSVSPPTFSCSDIGPNVVELLAEDDSGNTGACTALVTIADSLPPTIVCANVNLFLDMNGQAVLDPASATVTIIDNCGSNVTLSASQDTFTCSDLGPNAITITVTDFSGNATTCNPTVTVADTIDPTVVCEDITIQLDSNGSATLQAADVFDEQASMGSCSAVTPVVVSPDTFNCGDIGSNVVVLEAEDDNNNSSTCTAIVTVADTIPPIVECLDVELFLDENGQAMLSPAAILDTAASSDNCSGVSPLSVSPDTFDCSNIGANTVVLLAEDAENNTGSCTATVTISDTLPPAVVCNNVDLYLDANGQAVLSPSAILDTAASSDNCGVVNAVSVEPDTFDCGDIGTTMVLLTAADNDNNTDTCTAEVTVFDTVPPNVVCQDVDLFLDANGQAVLLPAAVLDTTASSDNCSGVTALSVDPDTFSCADVGAGNVITLTAEDAEGNTATCTATATVSDTIPPLAVCQDITVQLDVATGLAVINPIDVDGGSSDNCVNVTVETVEPDSFDCTQAGPNVVTLTVSDDAGLTDSCTATVTVQDTSAPMVVCPMDVTVSSPDPIAVDSIGPVEVSDDCLAFIDTTYTLDLGGNITSGNGDVSGNFFEQGTTLVTYTVTDDGGNSGTCSFSVTVENLSPPMPVCPADTTVLLDTLPCSIAVGDIGVVLSDTGATDTVFYTLLQATAGEGAGNASGTFFNVGLTEVEYFVFDTIGQSDSCSFTVLVVDTLAPQVSCPDTLVVNTDDNNCGHLFSYFPMVEECSNFTVQYFVSGATTGLGLLDSSTTIFLNPGLNQINYQITDQTGRSDSCLVTVIVNDSVPPQVTCPLDRTVPNTPGLCEATVSNIGLDDVNDNCGIASITYLLNGDTTTMDTLDASGSVFPVGETTVTYTVTDISGNTTTCSFIITVQDNEAPTLDCPMGTITLIPDFGSTMAAYNFVPPIIENCSVQDTSWTLTGATMGSGQGALDTFLNQGTTIITFTVVDSAGNEVTCTFNVFVDDAPSIPITCPEDTVVVNAPGQCGRFVNDLDLIIGVDPALVDSVSYQLTGATTGQDSGSVSGTFFNVGTTFVTYSVFGNGGTPSSCNFQVQVNDTEPPTITCPPDTVLEVVADQCFATVSWPAPVTADNCPFLNISSTAQPGDTFQLGTTIVNYVVVDGAGNLDNCNFSITLEDDQAPTVVCPDDITVASDEDDCGAIVTGIQVSIDENCGVEQVRYQLAQNFVVIGSGFNNASGEFFGVGTTSVTYNVEDVGNNFGICQFNVTVVDSTAPMVVCPGDQVVVVDIGDTSGIADDIDPVMTSDNCEVVDTTYVLNGATTGTGMGSASGEAFNLGTTDVTYIVFDEAGNSDTCSFQVTVVDLQGPDLQCPNDMVVFALADSCGAFVGDLGLTVLTDTGLVVDTTFSYDGLVGSGDVSGAFFELGMTVVTYTVTTEIGAMSSCSFKITVQDTTPPEIVCPPNQQIENDPGQCGAVATWANPFVDDNCSVSNFFCDFDSGDFFPVGATEVTCVATDGSGNVSSCTFTIEVLDTENPVIQCPTNLTVDNDPNQCGATLNDLEPLQLMDNCNDPSEIDISYSILPASGLPFVNGTGTASGQFFEVGLSSVLYTATDSQGNQNTCSFSIQVEDTEAPMVDCPPDTLINVGIGEFSTVLNGFTFGSFDNCEVLDTSYQITGATNLSGNGNLFDTLNLGDHTVTLVITDAEGLTDTCTFEISVINDNPFKISCPQDTVIFVESTTCLTSVQLMEPEVQLADTLIDTLFFQIVGMSDTLDIGNVHEFPIGQTTVTATVINIFSTATECEFVVDVRDTFPPELECPQTITVFADSANCAVLFDTLAPTQLFDNCGLDTFFHTFSGATPAGSGSGSVVNTSFNVGVTQLQFVARDVANNVSSCTITVEVLDTLAPTITCSPDTVLYSSMDGCEVEYCDLLPDTSDNCGITSITYNLTGATPAQGQLEDCLQFELGTTTVDLAVGDPSGNFSFCSFTVEVVDTVDPFIICPDGNPSSNTIFDTCATEASLITPEVLGDNCVDFTLGYSFINSMGDTIMGPVPTEIMLPIGSTEITYTITDLSGNTASCTYVIEVVDDWAPVFNCLEDTVVMAEPGNCVAIVDAYDLLDPDDETQLFENCTLDSVYYRLEGATVDTVGGAWTDSLVITFNPDTTTVTLIAVDEFGNSDTCQFEVIVQQVPLDINVSADTVCEGTTVTLAANTAAQDATFSWFGPAEAGSSTGTLILSNVDVSFSGTYCVAIEFGDNCRDTACADLLVLEGPDLAISGDSVICSDGTVDGTLAATLLDTVSQDISWLWTNEQGDTLSTGPELIFEDATKQDVGTYQLSAVNQLGCAAEGVASLFVSLQPPAPTAESACDDFLCFTGTEVCNLFGTYPIDTLDMIDSVLWSANPVDGAGLPNILDVDEITVAPSEQGLYTYSFTTFNDGCPSQPAEVQLAVLGSPIAVEDTFFVDYQGLLSGSVVLNDQLIPGIGYSVTVLGEGILEEDGELALQEDGTFDFTPAGFLPSPIGFRYRICYDLCPDLCEDGEAGVTLITTAEIDLDNCLLTPVLTPSSQDGSNDVLRISCLEEGAYPENTLVIFNQWGDQVYQAAPYSNTQPWNGTYEGEPLPAGTYYYIFQLTPDADAQKGFITIYK